MEKMLGPDGFMPEAMSTSYVSRSIFEEVRKKFPEYIIRFASDNPRNPVNQADFGRGWEHYILAISQDLMGGDNGAFTELLRERDSAESPVIGIAHLDSSRVIRTGNL
jgi:hypothetical protein